MGKLGNAAGAVEAVFAVMSLADSTAPQTLNLEHPEPGPWQERLIRGAPARLLPAAAPKQVLSNSFGFGGVNAALLFGSPPLALDPVVDGTP
jgi:3-oxoacyl-[acyl-carrier-protein] synthase II